MPSFRSKVIRPVLLLTALAPALALAPGGSAEAAFPGTNGLIAFARGDFDPNIFTMAADGSGQTNLTNNTPGSGESDRDPAWSPDGTQIASTSHRGGSGANSEIYTMAANGSGQTNRTNNPANDSQPAWSPDGTQIAFSTDVGGGTSQIYTMAANGSGQTDRTNDNTTTNIGPAWSPDGTQIAFTRNSQIYTMAANGSGQTNRTNSSSIDDRPAWSPDGTQITFTTDRNVNLEVYTMAADGSGQTNRTNNPAEDYAPDWSPVPRPSTPLPDADGDGVPNASDGCPSTKGPASNAGCPVNRFSFGKTLFKKGFTILQVKVPGPGVVKAAQARVTKKKPALIKAARVKATKAGTVKLKLKPTKRGKKLLAKKGKFSVKAKVTYTPRGGKARSAAKRVTLKRAKRRR